MAEVDAGVSEGRKVEDMVLSMVVVIVDDEDVV